MSIVKKLKMGVATFLTLLMLAGFFDPKLRSWPAHSIFVFYFFICFPAAFFAWASAFSDE